MQKVLKRTCTCRCKNNVYCGRIIAFLIIQNGMTPLIQAISSGSVECVGALLEGGAQANLQTYEVCRSVQALYYCMLYEISS